MGLGDDILRTSWQIFRIGTARYAERPVTHAQTWASDSALYRFGRLSDIFNHCDIIDLQRYQIR